MLVTVTLYPRLTLWDIITLHYITLHYICCNLDDVCGTRLCCRMTLQQEDPRWVGAWWVGYLAAAVIMLFIAPVFFGYPPDPSTGAHYVARMLSLFNKINKLIYNQWLK